MILGGIIDGCWVIFVDTGQVFVVMLGFELNGGDDDWNCSAFIIIWVSPKCSQV